MENKNAIKFHGDGAKLFGIQIMNAVLTIITLGVYYPWARASNFKYIYQETEFAGSRFMFHGTGNEMFKGFVKLIVILIVLYGSLYGLAHFGSTYALIGVCIFYIGFMFLIPIAVHGVLKYRLSRTSWRGIHFGYRGDLKELTKLCFKGYFFTLITFGIYWTWLENDIRRYVFDHIRMGNVSFYFRGHGSWIFWQKFFGFMMCMFSFGIYIPWYIADMTNFYFDNIRIVQGENTSYVKSHITGGKIFKQFIVNLLIIVCTLGIGYSWVVIRYIRFILENIEIAELFDADDIYQTEDEYTNATGDDMADMLDIGLV